MEDDDLLARHRWVRIVADSCADGVWDRQGRLCDLEDLPVSDSLKERISAWMEWYALGADFTDRNSIPFDVKEFTRQGLEIARDVKRELPDWTVVYFDEARSNETIRGAGNKSRTYFEYEIVIDAD